MSEGREHRKRFYLKMRYLEEFENWMQKEPPMILFWKWLRWKNERPVKNW